MIELFIGLVGIKDNAHLAQLFVDGGICCEK